MNIYQKIKHKNARKSSFVLFIILYIFAIILPAYAAEPQETTANEKIVNSYFECIRDNPVLLRQFLLEMPKGGDLHHHIGGAVYPETFIDMAVKKNLYINTDTATLVPSATADYNTIPAANAYENDALYERIVTNWSLYNFHPIHKTANNHFFNISSKLRMNFTVEDYGDILTGHRRRASIENVLYLETMLRVRECNHTIYELANKINKAEDTMDENGFLDFRKRLIKLPAFKNAIKNASIKLEQIMARSNKMLVNNPGSEVEVRFQYYILRVLPKILVLADIITAFEMAAHCPLVVGINIVGPENNHTARKDYKIHMKMIAAIGNKYPRVKRDLHAGELVLGLAVPEALRFHIKDAVDVAGTHRIGHGTDIGYELDAIETVKKMKEKYIAVEILLTSNELLLGVKGNDHPFPFYVESGVPVVLAGDDPGMMRTTHTQEFYLAATRYPRITYLNLKNFSLNSIQYSFLDNKSKVKKIGVLSEKFDDFERKWGRIAKESIK